MDAVDRIPGKIGADIPGLFPGEGAYIRCRPGKGAVPGGLWRRGEKNAPKRRQERSEQRTAEQDAGAGVVFKEIEQTGKQNPKCINKGSFCGGSAFDDAAVHFFRAPNKRL